MLFKKNITNTVSNKLTIICVTYNAEESIKYTLESIRLQTFREYELLIIDGGSKDLTLEVIKNYNLRNIRIISESDRGIYDAMNKGIFNCTTDWFIFMNAGDTFASNNTLERLFKCIKPKSLIVYGNTIVKNTNQSIKAPKYLSRFYFYSHTLCHQSLIINKKVCEIIGVHNLKYKIIADRDFLYRASLKKIKFQKIDLNISIWDPVGYSSNNKNIFHKEEKEFRSQVPLYYLPITFILNHTIYV